MPSKPEVPKETQGRHASRNELERLVSFRDAVSRGLSPLSAKQTVRRLSFLFEPEKPTAFRERLSETNY